METFRDFLNEAKKDRPQNEIVLIDTYPVPSYDYVKEYCKGAERDVPEEDSDEYWDAVNEIQEMEWEDFISNSAGWKLDLGLCLVQGYAGLWNGNARGGKIMTINDPKDIVSIVRNCDDVKVYVDPEDGLSVAGYHHDGTNNYTIYQLTDRGEKYVYNHEDEMGDEELHDKLIETRGMVRKIFNV